MGIIYFPVVFLSKREQQSQLTMRILSILHFGTGRWYSFNYYIQLCTAIYSDI